MLAEYKCAWTIWQNIDSSRQMLLVLLLVGASCRLGVDVSQLFSAANYTCMRENGISFVVVRGYCSFGGVDSHAVQSLTNVRSAGLQSDVYMFPCRGKSASAQAEDLLASIPRSLYGTVWVDVETNPSAGCAWTGYSAAQNCAFLGETVSALQAKGAKVGIYASHYMWGQIFGDYNACTQLASLPLWYPHYDNNPSLSDFVQFGGWKTPFCKQYFNTSPLCGASVDRNYCPV